MREKNFTMQEIELKLRHENEIDMKLSNIGVIDITALSNNNILANLNLKVAMNDVNENELVSIILLDKNGNGLHDDFNIDLFAFAPYKWSKLSGQRFNRLNFYPLKKNQSIFVYGQFETIITVTENMVITSPSSPTDDFITFPYTLPTISKKTIYEKELNFGELIKNKKLIFIEFWGTWCKPCVKQIPDIKKLHKNYSKQIVIVGISSNDKKERLKEVVTLLDMPWPQIQMDEEVSKSFGEVTMFPLGILFDQYGKLISYGIKPKDIIKVLSKYD